MSELVTRLTQALADRATGHPMVADFGLALAIQGATGGRLTEAVLDARSDVHGLGCVLYEMLTGAPPQTLRVGVPVT